MTARLAGKAAMVSGGSRGIGAAIAKRFAAEGADIVITYVGNPVAAEETVTAIEAAGRRGRAVQANVADPAAARAAVEQAADTLGGGLDILVHSAGISEFAPIADTRQEDYVETYRRHAAINVEGVLATTAAAVPLMRDGGRVMLIGSVNAHLMPFLGTAIYGASKAAAAALARGWARDLGARGILVNTIQPGPIATEMNPDDERDIAKTMKAMTALKRYGRVGEIAALAAFLASDDASYITGATIDIDGGMSV